MLLRDLFLVFFLFIVAALFVTLAITFYVNTTKKKQLNAFEKTILGILVMPGYLISVLFDMLIRK